MTVVAIDGPAGSGKSTVARALADRLGFTYVDTGAMYRAIALAGVLHGVAPDEGESLADLLSATEIDLDGGGVRLDGTDVTDRIRAADVTSAVSAFAALPSVRARLVELQRDLARDRNVVMEGRDVGTAVFPAAEVKVFLTADLAERARRRFEESGGPGIAEVTDALAARDSADEGRKVSPLMRAADAHTVDTTARTITEVVDELVRLVEGKMRRER